MQNNRRRTRAVLVALAAATGACGDEPAAPERGPSLRILAGSDYTDTITFSPAQGLVVEVRNEDGTPGEGVEVLFRGSNMAVGSVSSAAMSAQSATVLDARGRGVVRTQLGDRSGDAAVEIQVPLYGLTDTARYGILPGMAVAVQLAPHDTIIELGTAFALRGGIVDRKGNARADAGTWGLTGTSVAIEWGTQRVLAREPGAATVRLTSTIRGVLSADTASVLVVPVAQIAWTNSFYDSGLTSRALTGRQIAKLGSGNAASWEPGADRLVANYNSRLVLISGAGSVSALNTPGVTGATWPEWSSDGWIYFHGYGAAGRRLFRIRPDGTMLESLAPTVEAEMPSPSPDGKSVVFSDRSDRLAILDLATRMVKLIPGVENATSPRWSPDGAWIAYLRHDGALGLVRPDSGDPREVGEGFVQGISWSPDSRWLAASDHERGRIVEVATGLTTPLSFRGSYPAWKR